MNKILRAAEIIFSKLNWLQYTASPTKLADGQYTQMQGDDDGNLKVSIAGAADGISLGSSSVGGGNNTYSTEAGDITGAIVNGTKGITITIVNTQLGTPTALNFAKGSVQRNRAGVITTCPLTNVVYDGGVLTLSDMADNFATGDTVSVTCVGPEKQINFRKLTKTNDDVTNHPVGLQFITLTDSGVISAVPCRVRGMRVNSTDAGTAKIWDNASAGSGTVYTDTCTPAVGSHELFNGQTGNGAYFTKGGTAISVTFFFEVI